MAWVTGVMNKHQLTTEGIYFCRIQLNVGEGGRSRRNRILFVLRLVHGSLQGRIPRKSEDSTLCSGLLHGLQDLGRGGGNGGYDHVLGFRVYLLCLTIGGVWTVGAVLSDGVDVLSNVHMCTVYSLPRQRWLLSTHLHAKPVVHHSSPCRLWNSRSDYEEYWCFQMFVLG